MKAEIISIGTEILLGEITDTNASYLAGQLPSLGIDLFWVSQVGDNRGRLLEVLKRAWERSDLVLTTGGLGPTADDITRETIAELLGETQQLDPELEARLRKRFGGMGMDMPLSNLKQAHLIASAEAIPNDNGTAPGWWVEKDGRMLAAMPGPPREMHPMWEKLVKPRLAGKAGTVLFTRTLKVFGLSEAAVGETVAPLLAAANPTLGIYARADGIHLRLAAKAADAGTADSMLDEGEKEIRSRLADNIWGTDEETLEAVCSRLLVEKGLTLAVMEDYSGGLLSAAMTELPDSRLFFKGGLVANSTEAMETFGVSRETIDKYGAVSPETADAMAGAARDFLKADIGISSTGIIESGDRPAGITYIGIAGKGESRLAGRPRRKQHVSTTAMFELRKMLLESREA